MSNRRSRLATLLLAASLALVGCSTPGLVTPELRSSVTGELLPQPLRTLALAMHGVCIATGIHAVGVERARAPRTGESPLAARKGCERNLSATWLGHSSVLLNVFGTTIITDPIISRDISVSSPLPVRLSPPPFAVAELPRIDIVLISHGDYDHLHMPSMREIAVRFPQAAVLVPAGVEREVRRAGFRNVRTVNVEETIEIGRLTITGLPVLHETRRNLLGIRDGEALAWEIAAGGTRTMFIGDTGHGPVFSGIGQERGPYDLALLPIGAYEPRPLVADMHSTPEEALQIARDLRARTVIAIHWGTFALSRDRPALVAARFRKAPAPGINKVLLDVGETVVLK